MILLGFDPGGAKKLGWCVAETENSGQLVFRDSCLADHASGAVAAALSKVSDLTQIKAAGIDSPLFWVTDGERKADNIVRREIRRLGAVNAAGTVQQVNSLRGACLSQGLMVAHLLRRSFPDMRITESHPKALLWLLKIASAQHHVADIGISHLSGLIESESCNVSDHERDAVLGAVAAWAMITKHPGWRDLFQEETNPFAPVPPVEYWMPVVD